VKTEKEYFALQINEATKLFVEENTKISYWKIITEGWGFKSEIKVDDSVLEIFEVFRGKDESIRMSDVILEQIRYVWEEPKKINRIILDNVVNEEIKKILEENPLYKAQEIIEKNWWNIGWLDGMTVKIINKIWKKIDDIQVYSDIDGMYGDKQYDILIILK